MLTFGEVRKIVAPYAGKAGSCSTSNVTYDFAKTVMQSMLIAGAHGGLKKLTVIACNGLFALPPEVELPVRARVNGRTTEIWGKWFSYQSIYEDVQGYPLAENVLVEDGTQTPLAHPLPQGGSVIGAQAIYEEDPGSTILVTGLDPTGREIFSYYDGEQIKGQKLSLVRGEIKHGPAVFSEITSVQKPLTNGYVALWAVNPDTDSRRFLGDYSPADTKPLYRRFRLIGRNCAPIARVTLLCRMRLKDTYHDNDLTLLDNTLALITAAQRVQSEITGDIQTADYKRRATDELLERDSGYKKVSGNIIQIYGPMSGKAVRNLF